MNRDKIYILGVGSVGMALAVHLTNGGRKATAVRTSAHDVDARLVEVTIVGSGSRAITAPVEMVSLDKLEKLDGAIVVTAKSYANESIAARLRERAVQAPVVILQNGVGVEEPYLELAGARVYRCVLYVAGQKNGDGSYTFIPVAPSPIGAVRGDSEELEMLVTTLNTAEFPFVTHGAIQQEAWKKATINAVFNTICTLLETDNGIFVRDERAAVLAREIVDECVAVMRSIGLSADAEDVMRQIFTISRRSAGQLISTLQDIHNGSETEIDHLNLAIARVAGAAAPPVEVGATRALGELVKIKAALRRKPQAAS